MPVMWSLESFSDLTSVQESANLALLSDEEAIGDGAGPDGFLHSLRWSGTIHYCSVRRWTHHGGGIPAGQGLPLRMTGTGAQTIEKM